MDATRCLIQRRVSRRLVRPTEICLVRLSAGRRKTDGGSVKSDCGSIEQVLGDGSKVLYVEIEALGKKYLRQICNHVPIAMLIPMDTSRFEYSRDGRLTLTSSAS